MVIRPFYKSELMTAGIEAAHSFLKDRLTIKRWLAVTVIIFFYAVKF